MASWPPILPSADAAAEAIVTSASDSSGVSSGSACRFAPPAQRVDQPGLDRAGGRAHRLAQGGARLRAGHRFQGVARGVRGPFLAQEGGQRGHGSGRSQ